MQINMCSRQSFNSFARQSIKRWLLKEARGRRKGGIFQTASSGFYGHKQVPVETLFVFRLFFFTFFLFFFELAPASLQPNFPFIEHFSELALWQIWQSYAATIELNVYMVGGDEGAVQRRRTRIITHTSRCLTCISI